MSEEPTEFEVSVPWGVIAGKSWGDENNFPVLVLHGIQDNCGSFDCLIPLLPKGFNYICIDLPGHGKSTPLPEGLPIDTLDFFFTVLVFIQCKGLKSFYLIGHSFGGQIGFMVASIFPEMVQKLVLLDSASPTFVDSRRAAHFLRNKYEQMLNHIASMKTKQPPSYSYQEALDKLLTKRHAPLTVNAAKIIMKRSLVPSEGGYHFSTDQRMKLQFKPLLSLDHLLNFSKNIKCPVLLVLAKETYDKYVPIYGEHFLERLDTVVYGAPEIVCVTVEGTHDVHLNDAEKVSGHVSSFLLKQKSNL